MFSSLNAAAVSNETEPTQENLLLAFSGILVFRKEFRNRHFQQNLWVINKLKQLSNLQ